MVERKIKISNFKLSYIPGPKKVTHGSAAIKPYLEELKQLELPRDVNNITYYFNSNRSEEETKEIIRRLAGVYHTGSEARFLLAAAQLKRYSNFLTEDSDSESHLWVSSVLLNSAIINYQSLFDLILQVSWVFYRIYSYYPVSKNNPTPLSLTSENHKLILQKCTWEKIAKYHSVLDSNYFNCLKAFYKSDTYSKVNDLANSIKHRQIIDYEETSVDDQVLIQGRSYCSADTSNPYRIDDVIALLKSYHSSIYDVIKSLANTHKLK